MVSAEAGKKGTRRKASSWRLCRGLKRVARGERDVQGLGRPERFPGSGVGRCNRKGGRPKSVGIVEEVATLNDTV